MQILNSILENGTTIGQLTGDGDDTFEYDQNGNREDSSVNGITSIGQQNRLEADDTYAYTYDNEGNLTRREALSDTSDYTTFEWDHRNQLIRVEVPPDFISKSSSY